MEIVIPTRGRVFQETWLSLPESLRDITTFITTAPSCVTGKNVIQVPPDVVGIGPKRQWIIDHFGPKVIMMDDDLTFGTRRVDEPTKFLPSKPADLISMVEGMRVHLDKFAHVGVATREGGNRDIEPLKFNGRILRIHGFRTDVLRKEGVRFDRLPFMSDFDVTLQLLEKGYTNVKLNWIVHNQRSSNAPGGCSTYRTIEGLRESAIQLKLLHPDFVSLVEKQTKGAWNGKPRTDVVIQWKRAFDSARKAAVLDPGTEPGNVEKGNGIGQTVEYR